jgi:transcriptional regulator with XRE-family HTH domain
MNINLPIEIRRFKKIREEQGYTQQAFAELLGIKSSTADIERGKIKLSGTVVMQLLNQFGVNPLWLFGKSLEVHLRLDQSDVSPKVIAVDPSGEDIILLVNQKAAAGYPNNVQDMGLSYPFARIPQCDLSWFSSRGRQYAAQYSAQ